MKKTIQCIAAMLVCCAVHGQGTVSFKNKSSASFPPIDARILAPDGVTPINGNAGLAALYAGPSASSLQMIGLAVGFGTTTASAGYVAVGPASTRVVPTVMAGDIAFVQVRAWMAGATSYEDAISKGIPAFQSNILSLRTGGAGSPPTLPTELIGLQGFAVPEPTTFALLGMGVAALAMRRRR